MQHFLPYTHLTPQVFTNKAIFSSPTLRLNQSTFAFFHFTITTLTLYLVSRPPISFFTPSPASFTAMIPLSLAMCLNVVLPNLSLAFSSVAFYQIVRVLLTPLTAIINLLFYGTSIPRRAVYCLAPICCGVIIVSYYDTRPVRGTRTKTQTTQPVGVFFAFAGVLASSLYTVWIGTYHKKFGLNSMQLLFNQAPISAVLLLYVIPFTDTPPSWTSVPQRKWGLILLVRILDLVLLAELTYIRAESSLVSSISRSFSSLRGLER
jgi:solute carrier family 35 protein E3